MKKKHELIHNIRFQTNALSSLSCARSDSLRYRCLPILSVVSSPDELIVGRFFSGYEVIRTVCAFCALSPSAFGTTNLSTQYLVFFFSPSALFIRQKKL